MKVFELVKSVLDENYSEILGTAQERDSKIRERIRQLAKSYSELARRNELTYQKPSIRFAYIFKYLACHSNLVYRKIQENGLLRDLFLRPQIVVSCIGGGPGSDLVGILKFMAGSSDKDGERRKLRCHILDGENAWADTWSDVDDKLDCEFKVSTNFIPMDVTKKADWSQQSKYLSADLFTMIYFASEIFSRQDECVPFFRNLFAKMKPGALFLYIDNNASCFTDWFDSLARDGGLEVLRSEEGVEKMPKDEEKAMLGEFLSKFGAVKLDADVACRIWRKPKQP